MYTFNIAILSMKKSLYQCVNISTRKSEAIQSYTDSVFLQH